MGGHGRDLLDAAAVVVSVTDTIGMRVLDETEKGPLTALVYGTPTIDRIARAASIRGRPHPRWSSSRRASLATRRRHQHHAPGIPRRARDGPDLAEPRRRFRRRGGLAPLLVGAAYDRPLRALAALTHAKPAPVHDGPPGQGRPPSLPAAPDAPGGLEHRAARAGRASVDADLELPDRELR